VDTKKDGKDVKLDQMEEIGIELDCEEVTLVAEEVKKFELICDPKKVANVEADLMKMGFSVDSAEIQFRALHPSPLQGEDATKVEKFYEMIQEDENIKQIFDNIEPES